MRDAATRPCFWCRLGAYGFAPFSLACHCNHEHDFRLPENAVAGRAALVAVCGVCGLEAVDDVDGGD